MILQWIRYAGIHLPKIDSDMKKNLYFIFCIIGGMILSASCEISLEEPVDTMEFKEADGRLSLRLVRTGRTKSSISPDEDNIRELCVTVYRKEDGLLMATQTAKTAEEIGFDITSGEYNVYVTANMESFEAPPHESEIKNAGYKIESFEDLGNGLPMSWCGTVEVAAGSVTTINAELERLVSKVGLNVETGVLEGLEIVSVRLFQGAGVIRPFMQGGNRMTDAHESMDGDYATDDDLALLTEGETMYFYVTENCQGTLLPDNTDPWAKVPDSIGNTAGLCTYIEMKGRWNDMADYEGEVTYRFYLGEDASGNFDIRRNSIHDISLYLEEESFDRISWKIDASKMDIARWEVISDLSRNFHDKDEFYVTENILIEFQFDEKGQKYWSKRNNRFLLAGVDSRNNRLIQFKKPTDLGEGRFQASGTCLSSGDFEVIMINSQTGKTEYIMDYGTVLIPKIVAGWHDFYSTEKVEAFDEETELTVNGKAGNICLYLTDKDGYNLNQSRFYGCDFSVCDWIEGVTDTKHRINTTDLFDISSETGICGNDGYAIRYTIGISNDGLKESKNEKLLKSLGRGVNKIWFDERGTETTVSQLLGLYCDDIKIRFRPTPDSIKGYLQSEFMYEVDNPSNLPLSTGGLKLNSLTKVPFRSDIRQVVWEGFTGSSSTDPLLISLMPYSYCSLEETADGAAYTTLDGKLCFAADDNGIKQSDIPYQMAMFHNLEAKFGYEPDYWVPEITGSIDLYDTTTHGIIYGCEGFINCGMAFHAYKDSYKLYDDNNALKTDFKEYGTLLDKNAIGQFNEIVTVDFSINEQNQIVAAASEDIELKISLSGTLTGHIRCVSVQDPFFTVWGHYFTHEEIFSSSGTYNVGQTAVPIDGSTLTGAFDQMRNEPYYSNLDVWDIKDFRSPVANGSIREYLKPVSIGLKIDIMSPEGTPVAVRFSGSARYEYTTSSPVTWSTGLFSSVTMVPSSYSGFDSKLDDDDCPPGALFGTETLYLQPTVTFNPTNNIYYMNK